ncbi:MAG TPA: hypothetical protein VI168_00530 [Croceibacterium sp.]
MTKRRDPAIRWRISLRLLGALRLGSVGTELALLLGLVAFLALNNAAALGSGSKPALSHGGLLLAMLTYLLFAWTGPANAGWHRLPVSRDERGAAAWLLVGVIPLLLDLVSCLLAALLLRIGDRSLDANHLLTLFGLQGLLTQGMAGATIVFGQWPQTRSRFLTVSGRKPAGWLMVCMIGILLIGGALVAGSVEAPEGLGVFATLATLAVGAALLPLSTRFARLDPPLAGDRTELHAWHERLRLSGWSGHFSRETTRSLAVAGFVVISGLIVLELMPFAEVGHRPGAVPPPPLRSAFAQAWAGPALTGAFAAAASSLLLMRQRRTVLCLPGGELLVLLTPAYCALLGFLPVAFALTPVEVAAPSMWLGQVATGALVALALAYALLAGMLRSTTTAQVLLTGIAVTMAGSLLGAVALIAATLPGGTDTVTPWVASASALALIVGFGACVLQLRRSRGPYQLWPLVPVRWNSA